MRLEPTDEARVLAWQGKDGARIEPGDVLAVQFRNNDVAPPASDRARRRCWRRRRPCRARWSRWTRTRGKLLAMVGGYDFRTSQFNRATQARRQIGSAIKPFIYAAAIDEGMTPLTIKWDAPVKFKTASGIWAPHNYKPEYLGPLTLRMALAKSINTVSAQLVAQMGVDKVVDDDAERWASRRRCPTRCRCRWGPRTWGWKRPPTRWPRCRPAASWCGR